MAQNSAAPDLFADVAELVMIMIMVFCYSRCGSLGRSI